MQIKTLLLFLIIGIGPIHNVVAECEYNFTKLKKISQNIYNKASVVVRESSAFGNIDTHWNNTELAMAIYEAERVLKSDNCEKEAEAFGLPEAIRYGNTIKGVGETRVNNTLELMNRSAESLRKSFSVK